MKNILKFLIKIINNIFSLIFSTFIFSATYDLDKLERDAKELDDK